MLPGCKPAFTFPSLFKLLCTFSRPQSPHRTPLRWWSRSRWCGWGWRFWCGNARRSVVSPSGVLTPPLPPSSSTWGSHLRTHRYSGHVCVEVDRLCSLQAGYLLATRLVGQLVVGSTDCWSVSRWIQDLQLRLLSADAAEKLEGWRNAGAEDCLWVLIMVCKHVQGSADPVALPPVLIRPSSECLSQTQHELITSTN